MKGGTLMGKETLGQRLKMLREEKGWTQVYAVKKFGITNGALSNYERDERVPDALMLKKFAEVYGTTIDYLMGKTDIRDTVDEITNAIADDPDLVEFWNILKKRPDLKLFFKQTKDLSPKTIKQVIRVIKAIEDEESATM